MQVGSDGIVHNGNNLITSFQQLSGLDANHDGVINGAELNGISVWQDANGDGVCQPHEVVSLASLGVTSISLQTNVVSQSISGDIISQTAIATMADGTTREVAAVELNTSNVYTTYVGSYTLTPAIEALPDLKGYGVLPNLRVAMSLDGVLQTAVQNLAQINPSSTAAYDSALQNVLYEWAGVEGVSPQSGGLSDGQKLAFLQSLINNHSTFFGSPVPTIVGQADAVENSWNDVFAALKARILVQTPGSGFDTDFSFDPGTDILVPTKSFSEVIADLQANQPAAASDQLSYWSNALLMLNTSVSDLKQFLTIDPGAISQSLASSVPSLFTPEILAAAASGSLTFVEGQELGNRFPGTVGADLFQVTSAGSILQGLGGGDEFIVANGLGTTEIDEVDNAASPDNVLLLSSASPGQVSVSGDAAGDIILKLADGSSIQLDGMLSHPTQGSEDGADHKGVNLNGTTAFGVQKVLFMDGTVWTAAQLIQTEVANGDGHGNVYGSVTADVFDGHGTFRYEQGNGGGDTFIYNEGYGPLEINEVDSSAAPANVLQLGTGITAANLTIASDASGDVILNENGGGGRVQIDGMLSSGHDGVQTIQFSDGSSWSLQQMRQMLATGTPNNTTLIDVLGDITLDPAGYAHLVTTQGGNDTILFNNGYGAVEINQRDGNAVDDNILQFGNGISASDVTTSGDGRGNIVLTVGSSGDQVQLDAMLLGGSNGVQTIRFADGTIWGAQQIIDQVPASEVSGSNYYQTVAFDKGQGPITTSIYGNGAVVSGSDISSGDVYTQGDARGDLIVKLRSDPNDSLTLAGDLYENGSGLASRLGSINFADGSSINLLTNLTYTWVGTGSQLMLTGTNNVQNVFDLGTGGDLVTEGNSGNTIVFNRGDGHAVVDLNGGTSSVEIASNIARSDVALQSNAAGDLTVDLLDIGDTVTFRGDLDQGVDVYSQLKTISLADGSSIDLSNGDRLLFTEIGTSSNTTLVGSSYGSNLFLLGAGGDTVTTGNGAGAYYGGHTNTFDYGKGDGAASITLGNGTGILSLGAGISASDLSYQSDAAGDLTVSILGDPSDSVTFKGDLDQGVDVYSQLKTISLADGSSIDLSNGDRLLFTEIGTSSNTTLVGSSYGSNLFLLGAGGDTVTTGNGAGAYYGGHTNTFDYGKGDGAASITLGNGTGILSLGAGISASGLIYQADNSTGNLTIIVDGSGDSVVIDNDLYNNWGTPTSQLGELTFSDGTSVNLNQPLTFTWAGTSTNTTLVGSNFGTNAFNLGAGGDQVTFGSGNNVVNYATGDGAATINLNSASGTVAFGTGITAGSLIYQADTAGDLTIKVDGSGDSVVIDNDLYNSWGTPTSHLGELTFSDGTSVNLNQPLTFTWAGTSTNTTLVGSNFGTNAFNLGAGGDQVTFGSGNNVVNYATGDGAATINLNSASGTVAFGTGITAGSLIYQADTAGDLTIKVDGSGDSVVIDNDLYNSWGTPTSHLGELTFSDGTSVNLNQSLTFTWAGTSTNTTLIGSNFGANAFNLDLPRLSWTG